MRRITETKCTCRACGNVWFYGKAEAAQQTANALNNAGNALLCCGGCLPAAFLADKKVVDLGQCPKCRSKAVTKETVTHEVP